VKRAGLLCPVPGCGCVRKRWQAVCRTCWARLPSDIRVAIGSAREGQRFAQAAKLGVRAVQWLVDHPIDAAIARVTGEASIAPP
jgi:hypothetical protein